MSIQIEPSGQVCGATVTGIDLTVPLDTGTVAAIRTAWLEHHVIAFPDQAMTDDDLEVARAAKRAMWKIVRHTGRPGARNAKMAVVAKLCGLLGADQPVSVRREVVWMLSEIGGLRAIRPLAELLSDEHLREDARAALERIPAERALQALKAGFEVAPEDFKPNLAQSLRKRGQKVSGYPCVKLVPSK